MDRIPDRDLYAHLSHYKAGFADPAEPERDEHDDYKADIETQLERNHEQESTN